MHFLRFLPNVPKTHCVFDMQREHPLYLLFCPATVPDKKTKNRKLMNTTLFAQMPYDDALAALRGKLSVYVAGQTRTWTF